MFRKSYFLMLVGLASILLMFQNCGGVQGNHNDSLSSTGNATLSDIEVNESVLYTQSLILNARMESFSFSLIQITTSNSSESFEIRVTRGARNIDYAVLKDPRLSQYSLYAPVSYEPTNNIRNDKLLFILSDNTENILGLLLTDQGELNILWELPLASPTTYGEFSQGHLVLKPNASISITINSHIIQWANTQSPQISSCDLISSHIEGDLCALNIRTCQSTTGQGEQTWNGSAYGTCAFNNCIANYHVESNACLPNTRSCPIANGAGSQSWNGSAYNLCQVTSCNTGYYSSGSSCIRNTGGGGGGGGGGNGDGGE